MSKRLIEAVGNNCQNEAPTPAQVATGVTALRDAMKVDGTVATAMVHVAFNNLATTRGTPTDNAMETTNVTDTDPIISTF
jgi:hypothetical protein